MGYIDECGSMGRAERGARAKDHTLNMTLMYNDEIAHCIEKTTVYSVDFNPSAVEKRYDTPTIYLLPIDSVSAIFSNSDGKTAVLNFASHKNPGGMFYEGSKAQEEGLCHESFLYNILVSQADYYAWNNQHKNRALYVNRGLYTPDVRFIRDNDTTWCDVITCACPNWGSAEKWGAVTPEENTEALKSRIKFVLDIAADNKVDTLILGAFGCGVFKQNPEEVAEIFKEFLSTTHRGAFKQIIFPIPPGPNFTGFKRIFEAKK